MNNKATKLFVIKLLIAVALVLICLFQVQIVSAETAEFKSKKYSDKYIEWLELSDEERKNTIAPPMYAKNIEEEATTGPTRIYTFYLGASRQYNLRDEISGLKIKNQQQTEQCWAFATTTQLESYMLKINNNNMEFSPRHIEYSTARTFLDGINPKRIL